MKKKKVTYKGFISVKLDTGCKYSFICLENGKQSVSLYHRLAEISLYYKHFSIRYGVSTEKFNSVDELQLKEIEKLEANYPTLECRTEDYHYSEWTSGTDYIVEMQFGGHNLDKELFNHNRKYCIIEITYW